MSLPSRSTLTGPPSAPIVPLSSNGRAAGQPPVQGEPALAVLAGAEPAPGHHDARGFLGERGRGRAVHEADEALVHRQLAQRDRRRRPVGGRRRGPPGRSAGRRRRARGRRRGRGGTARREQVEQRQPAVALALHEGPRLVDRDALDRHPARPVRVEAGHVHALDVGQHPLAVAEDRVVHRHAPARRHRERRERALHAQVGVELAGQGAARGQEGLRDRQVQLLDRELQVHRLGVEPDLAARVHRAAGAGGGAQADLRRLARGPREVADHEPGVANLRAPGGPHRRVHERERAVLDRGPAHPEVELGRGRRGRPRRRAALDPGRGARRPRGRLEQRAQRERAVGGALDPGPRLLQRDPVDGHGGRVRELDAGGLEPRRGHQGLAGVRERQVGDRGGAARGERERLERGLHRQVAARLARSRARAPAGRAGRARGPPRSA